MENNDFFELSLPNQQDEHAYGADRKPKKPFKKTITLKQVINWINSQEYNDEIKEKLIGMVKRQPAGILNKFYLNVDKYVNSIIINARKNK
jgi:hypothetical protein